MSMKARIMLAAALAVLAGPAAAQKKPAAPSGKPAAAKPATAKPAAKPGAGGACVTCHAKVNPNIVKDWELSRHSQVEVDCVACHGAAHKTKDDFAKATMPTPDTCAQCHDAQVAQFKKGKHAFAWAAVKAMPTFHYQPVAIREGLKGCGGCHKLGLKTAEEQAELRKSAGPYGNASCDACHTRHLFSKAEARRPEACQTCHMGFDHPQWEMYSGSKHGVRNALKQTGAIPEHSAAPTCQTCHMQEGNHEVRTAWGFLAVRLPFPENDPQWKADRITILQGLGVLDPSGNPTGRLEVVKAADVARLTEQASAGRAHEDAEDLQPVPLRRVREGPARAVGRHDPRRGPRHGGGHPHDRRAVQGRHPAEAQGIRVRVPRPPHVPRRAHADRAEALRHVPRAPHARVPGRVPREPGLRELVRVERDGARPRRDQGGGGDAPARARSGGGGAGAGAGEEVGPDGHGR